MVTNLCRKLIADRRGATAIMIALMAALLIGFAGLGVEVVQALETQRHMQAVADSAALSAANAQLIGSPSPYTYEGFALAAKAGYSSGQTTACVSTSPQVYVGAPCAGRESNAAYLTGGYVEAFIEAPFTLQLAHVVFPGNFTLHGRAVAHIPPSNPSCSIALKPNNSSHSVTGLTVNSGKTVNYLNCSVSVNANAIKNGTSGTFCATDIYVGGTIGNNGNSGFTTSTTCGSGSPPLCSNSTPSASCVPNAPAALNPWADTTPPTCGSYSNVPGGNTVTIGTVGATVNCYNGFSLTGQKSVTLNPGVYVINGSISMTGSNTVLAGTGVTIFLTGTGTVNLGGGTATLTAQTAAQSPTYGGLLFYSTSSGSSSFGGGNNTSQLTGVIVMANQDLTYHGTPVTTGNQCSEIVASTITFSGDSTLSANCAGFTNKQIQQPAILVE